MKRGIFFTLTIILLLISIALIFACSSAIDRTGTAPVFQARSAQTPNAPSSVLTNEKIYQSYTGNLEVVAGTVITRQGSSGGGGGFGSGGRFSGGSFGSSNNGDLVLRAKQEEVWVVPTGSVVNPSKRIADDVDNTTAAAPAQPDVPTSPILVIKQNNTLIPIPLTHTDVSADITGYIASVNVTQHFSNPYATKIEAVYVFPLPENAGVSDFLMTIGDRHIRGIIRPREEAEKIYNEAKAQGYVASMMTEQRPNIFTQSVANIEPGKKIDIDIRYFHTLTYNDGWMEWVFPMVVGPRYNPAGSTNGVGAVARDNRGASNQKTEIQYLAPNERSGHDISLSVHINAGVAIEDLTSVNHKISRIADNTTEPNQTLVKLDPADSLPNKDFVLRYKIAGDKVKAAMFVQREKPKDEGGLGGGYFTLMLVPPESLKSLPRRPVEMVFVIDTSGSMNGRPIEQAKAAVNVALDHMQPDDTFQIVQFDSTASTWSAAPMPVSAESIASARQYIATMHGANGTEMLQGIHAALDFPHDPSRTRVVAFLTDGFIGNEIQILQALHDKLETSRVFSFGVGPSTNRYLLDAMASLSNGNAAYLSLNEKPEPVMEDYFSHISHPALSNLQLNFANLHVTDVFPTHLPDLFVGRPILITGRFTGELPTTLTLTGQAAHEDIAIPLSLSTADIADHPAIANIWARMKITDLEHAAIFDHADTTADIRTTALNYNLMSAYTSFVAVDSTQITAGDHGISVAVPVPVPDGVRYDTTVQTKSSPPGEN